MSKENDILETTLSIAEKGYLSVSFFEECLSRKTTELWTANIIFPYLLGRWSQSARGGFGMAAKSNS